MTRNDRVAKLEKPYANKVIGSGEEDPEQLLANPANFRIHPDNQQQALAGSIDGVGWIDPVIVNKRSGHVIDGHLRVTLALRSGVKSIPVTYVDLDEAEEAQALLSLDPIAAMAATDKQQLDALLRIVQSDDERVQAMMGDIEEKSGEVAERVTEIRPRKMFHVLLSVPVDGSIELRTIVLSAQSIPGCEVVYGAN